MARTAWSTLDQPGFVAVFGIGSGAVFLVTLIVRLKQSRHLADASIDGLNAAYPNTGFVGLPLCMLAFGHASLAPAVIATIMERVSAHLEVLRDHPLTTRRYYKRVAY